LRGQNLVLRPANAIQDRGIARKIAVHTHPQIDLLGRRIGSIFRHQSENRIGAQALKLLKQKLMPLYWFKAIIVHGMGTPDAVRLQSKTGVR